jgi:DNA-binding response OmpR family regulator
MPWTTSTTDALLEAVSIGSGKLGCPWRRMHLANLNAPSRWLSDIFGGPPLKGNSFLHACCAAWNPPDRGLTPDCGLMFSWPPAVGSGKFGTPWERMQSEKASPVLTRAAVVELGLFDDPHAASAATQLVAASAAGRRAPDLLDIVASRLYSGPRNSAVTLLCDCYVRCGILTWTMRVLVVEDHPRLAETVATVLRREGMAVDIAFDGREALNRAALTNYDVVVLDRDLPGVHGDEVCRAIVAEGNSAVLMLTAAGAVEDRVRGLGLGADDYLPKPFHIAELIARVRAVGRRSRRAVPPTLAYRDLTLDTSLRLVTRSGRPVALSPKEFAVLEVLLGAEGAVVSTEEILERAWDDATDPFTNAVRMTVSRLRAKLGEPPVIQTVTPVGYRIGEAL